MRTRHEALSFNEHDWTCVTFQLPLGVVTLARRLPGAAAMENGASELSRQFASSNRPGSAVKRIRWRR